MSERKPNDCQSYRDQLISLLLEGKAKGLDIEQERLSGHLSGCPGCRSFWAAITGLKSSFDLPDFYTTGLKYRTMKRLAAEAETPDHGFLGLMIPVSLLSLLCWFAIPLMLLTWLFDYWLARPWHSLLLSTLLLTSLGFLIGSLAFLGLTRGRGAEQLKGRMKELLEGFHG